MRAPRSPAKRELSLLAAAAFLSGTAALTYEILWVRHLGDVLGSTAYAVNVVLAVFFTGLGVGAWTVGRVADRRGGSLGLFVALELTIAVWGALLFWPLADLFDRVYVSLAPAEWPLARALPVKGLAAALLLAVPTLAMGGTLPALARHAVRTTSQHAARVGRLYGLNTLGAALGVGLAVFVLLPELGLRGAGLAAAALNGLAILSALASRPRGGRGGERGEASTERTVPEPAAPAPEARAERGPEPAPPEPDPPGALAPGTVLLAAAWAGFVSVGLEVLWTRALAMRFLSTVYSFATILVVFLLCIGLGSLVVGRLDRRGLVTRGAAATVMAAAGLAGLASVAVLIRLGEIELGTLGRSGAASGFAGFQLREAGQALAVMAVPTLLFGLNFPLLARLAHESPRAVGRELGTVYLANTVGSVAAPLAIGFGLLPRLGLRTTLVALSCGAVAFALLALARWRGAGRGTAARLALASLALGVPLELAARGDVRLWRVTPDDVLLEYEEGAAAAVAVLEMPDGSRLLKINNAYNLGGTRTWYSQERQGLIPLLLADAPRTMLFIGAGSGSSAGAAAAHGRTAVDVLEIVPGLADQFPLFATENTDLSRALRERDDVRLLEVDGRHFIRTTPRRYDVVVGDLFIPWRAGEGGMYTREHLAAVRHVLEPGGLFCQWLPLYQLTPPDLRTIAATFCDVFPEVQVFWGYFNARQPMLCLVGSVEPPRLSLAGLRAQLADPARAALFASTGLDDPLLLLGSWVTDRAGLVGWTRGAPLETRDRPRIEFAAPLRRTASASPAAQDVPVVLALATPPERGQVFDVTADELEAIRRAQRGVTDGMRGLHARHVAGAAGGPDEAGRDAAVREAIEALGRALEELPEWTVAAVNLRQIVDEELAAGRFALALAAAEALQRSATKGHYGYYHAARVLRAEGRLEEALAALRRALELEPAHTASRELLEKVQIELLER